VGEDRGGKRVTLLTPRFAGIFSRLAAPCWCIATRPKTWVTRRFAVRRRDSRRSWPREQIVEGGDDEADQVSAEAARREAADEDVRVERSRLRPPERCHPNDGGPWVVPPGLAVTVDAFGGDAGVLRVE
jgi:hypothetical protein